MAPSSTTEILVSIGKELQNELDETSPSIQRLGEMVDSLEHALGKQTMTISLLQQTQIGVTLHKAIKTFRRSKRTASTTAAEGWEQLMDKSQALLQEWKKTADNENKQRKEAQTTAEGDKLQGLPKTVSDYRARLTSQGKDMYKDPPVLPPATIVVEDEKCPEPKRDKSTGKLMFVAGSDESLKSVLKDFHPNRTPEEVLRAGSFGGTYFRPIKSAVTNVHYNSSDVLQDTLPSSWIDGLDKKTLLTSSTYRVQVNKYGVKCGGSLGMWESSGWITDSDPYGWFQWYCRFYQGRRCSDDSRQISRWLKSAGPKGRFRSQLCNKILAANAKHDNASVSPVIRQTLLHWGLEITPDVLEQHKKRVK